MFKKPSFILGVVAVIAVLTAAISTTLALRAPKESPQVSLWVSSGSYTRVKPMYDCDFDLKECLTPPDSVQPTHIEVGPNDRVLVSVPEEAAKGWLLDVVWFRETPEGPQIDHPQPRTFLKKEDPTFATWIEPRRDGWRLLSLSVEVPSRVLDPTTDNVLSRAVWAVFAAPALTGVRIGG